MKYTYPHTINNGHGEELTFIRIVQDGSSNAERLEVENKVLPGAGPPMHVHHIQDESLTIMQGKLGAQILGKEPTFHGPGETLTFYRGVAHRFWNAGEDVLICKGWISPPNNIAYFLTEIFKSVKANGGKRPSMFDAAFLQMKYASEFDTVEIPRFVKAVVFPVVVALGKAMGKDKKFKDAPGGNIK
jgi:quercetin dioxygenase-like cupin family protein